MIKCDKNCNNGIIYKQIGLGEFIELRCECTIRKEMEAYENWFKILRKA